MEKKQKQRLMSQIGIFRMEGVKPNYSAIARAYGVERHTVAKYYKSNGEFKKRKPRSSSLDPLRDEIEERLGLTGMTIKAVYFYFKNERKIECTYSNFKTYVRKHNLFPCKGNGVPHPFFETEAGKQLQVDWKEDLCIHTTEGEAIKFNVFSSTLGCSRYHIFLYSEGKGEKSFRSCLCKTFEILGGKTKEVLTDNMSAIVSVEGGKKKKHPSIIQFEKDLGIEIKLCKIHSPETKGKDESANRFVNWIKAYDGKIKNKEDLKEKIKDLTREANREVNQSTGVPPVIAFNKEKEYLEPISNSILRDEINRERFCSKVPSSFLISYNGSKYSVPPEYIGKVVNFEEVNGYLYIYYKEELIATHATTETKKNYKEEHYSASLVLHGYSEKEAEELTKRNLSYLGGKGL